MKALAVVGNFHHRRFMRPGRWVGAALVAATLSGNAEAQTTGAVLGLFSNEQYTFARLEKSAGWVSFQTMSSWSGPTFNVQVPAVNRGLLHVGAYTTRYSVNFLPLAPGHYGIVQIRSSLGVTSGHVLKPGGSGQGATYEYALVEFDVLPSKVTNAGALVDSKIMALPDAAAAQAAASSSLPVIRRHMVITH